MVGKTKTFIVLTDKEADELVSSFLQREYSFVASEEANNGCAYTFNVDPKNVERLAEYTAANVNRLHSFRFILEVMCASGLILAGDYLVEVNW